MNQRGHLSVFGSTLVAGCGGAKSVTDIPLATTTLTPNSEFELPGATSDDDIQAGETLNAMVANTSDVDRTVEISFKLPKSDQYRRNDA